jgi:DNA-binding LacI/PurR family transcriptional regulator
MSQPSEPSARSRPLRRPEVRERIEAMIRGDSLRGRRLPGYRDLAREIGVSGRTLKFVLADLEADGLLERRHGSGTFVVDGAERRRRAGAIQVAVICGRRFDQSESWLPKGEMLRGVLGQLPRMRAEGLVLALDQSEDRARFSSARAMRGCSGFVLVGVEDQGLVHRLVALRRGPVVVLDSNVRSLPVVSVNEDSFGGAMAVTRHLLGLGHRRIAFIDLYDRANRNGDKHDGYAAALAGAGMSYDRKLVAVPGEAERPYLAGIEEFIGSAVEDFLAMPDAPTAIFAFNDARAEAAVEALEQRGLRVGRDISVAGFGDTSVRRGGRDWLTSCRIYQRKMGQLAARAALEAGNGSEGRSIIVPTRLVARRSTCPPAPRPTEAATREEE